MYLCDAGVGDDRPPVEEDERVKLHGRPPGHLRVVVALVEVVAAVVQSFSEERGAVEGTESEVLGWRYLGLRYPKTTSLRGREGGGGYDAPVSSAIREGLQPEGRGQQPMYDDVRVPPDRGREVRVDLRRQTVMVVLLETCVGGDREVTVV